MIRKLKKYWWAVLGIIAIASYFVVKKFGGEKRINLGVAPLPPPLDYNTPEMIASHPNSNAPPMMASHRSDNPNPDYSYEFYDTKSMDWAESINGMFGTRSTSPDAYMPLNSL